MLAEPDLKGKPAAESGRQWTSFLIPSNSKIKLTAIKLHFGKFRQFEAIYIPNLRG
jgi:hypothetical protein